MGKPIEENFLNYERSELMKMSPLLRGKNLLIVHGTVDRRVNIQHTMQLMKSLTKYGVQYRTQVTQHKIHIKNNNYNNNKYFDYSAAISRQWFNGNLELDGSISLLSNLGRLLCQMFSGRR